MSERLILVTDFGKLKAGDLVVVKQCIRCGRAHRQILLRWSVGECRQWRTGEDLEGFIVEPRARCANKEIKHLFVTRDMVASGRVYLVDTGLEQTQSISKAEPKLLERVR